MNDKQLLALARKNAAKSQSQTQKEIKRRRRYDPTLEATRPEAKEGGRDTEAMFREMKRREF